jgi:hypothetical protein
MKKEDILELMHSWENIDFIINEISKSPEYFDLLMDIAINNTDDKSWRAAYMADKVHDKNPKLFYPYIEIIIEKLATLVHLGKKRHFLKLLSMNVIPQKYYGFLVDFCLNTLSSAEPPAVRVHAMQILYNISETEKDLKPELVHIIEHEIEYHSTAGIISRGNRLLKKLRKQIN